MTAPSTAPSLTSRLVRATIAVAIASAMLLASAAALIGWRLWEAEERRDLEQSANGLATLIETDMAEEDWTAEEDLPEKLAESGLVGYRLEVWKGSVLVASNGSGSALGPPAAGPRSTASWLITSRSLPWGFSLLAAAPRGYGHRAARVFAWSLLLASPLCLGLALLAGRAVARRAARPLLDLRDRLQAAGPSDTLAPSSVAGTVAEVSEIETAFQGLWARLEDALSREKEFAANASHELRTPLTRIRLHAERARSAEGAEAGRELDELRQEVDRTSRLVDSLLILARDVTARVNGETANLADIVRDCVASVFSDASDVRVDAGDEALVRGDEELLRIAVANLLDNAKKYKAGTPEARVELVEDGDRVRLAVTSPGARVTAAQRPHLFERFYRSPESRAAGAGYGLGLALVRHIARLHGGEAECTSGPEEDVRFVLAIPAWRPDAAKRAAASTRA